MDPIRPINRYGESVAAVTPVGEALVRHETPDEAHERRQREQRERARRQAARAWADSQLQALQAGEHEVIVREDESDDGRAHVDIRI